MNKDAVQRNQIWRLRVLEVSQQVTALHVAPAFSCTEITDAIYFNLLRESDGGGFRDVFIMSKGHGCIVQYVILESLGILKKSDLDSYCTANGILGAHPDFNNPGIEASTGSLGHGLGIATGQAYAERLNGSGSNIYCLLSDGEFQEGSTWEAVMMAANLELNNLIAFIDFNDFGGLEKMSDGHKAFAPLAPKVSAFGWEVFEVNGHSNTEIVNAVHNRKGKKPLMVVCKTVKGKGVTFMENVPIWHYRSPNPSEYLEAVNEIKAGLNAK